MFFVWYSIPAAEEMKCTRLNVELISCLCSSTSCIFLFYWFGFCFCLFAWVGVNGTYMITSDQSIYAFIIYAFMKRWYVEMWCQSRGEFKARVGKNNSYSLLSKYLTLNKIWYKTTNYYVLNQFRLVILIFFYLSS